MTIQRFFILFFLLSTPITSTNAQNAPNPFASYTFFFEGYPEEDSINCHTFFGLGRDSFRQLTINHLLSKPDTLFWEKNTKKSDHHNYYWLCFRLINRTRDTIRRTLITHHCFDYMTLYSIDNHTVVDSIVRGRFPPLSIKNAVFYQKTFDLQIPPQSQKDFYFHYYSPVKNENKDSVFLLSPKKLEDRYLRELDYHDYDNKFNSFLFTFLVMVMLTSLTQYYIFPKDRSFLYYMGYLFSLFLYYINNTNIYYHSYSVLDFSRPHYYFLEIVFSYACYGFYILFIIQFAETKISHNTSNILMRIAMVSWVSLTLIYWFIMYYKNPASAQYLFMLTKVAFLFVGFYSFYFIIKYGKSTWNGFIYVGSACLLFFALRGIIETTTSVLNFYPNNWFSTLDDKYRFVSIRFGVILESIFFSIGLIFKGKQLSKEQHLKELSWQQQYIEQLETSQKWQLKYQTELEEEIAIKAAQLSNLEKKQAIEQTRSQIAQDIHDEVGMHLTKIILTSELAALSTNDSLKNKPFLASHIAQEARQVVSKLKEIIFIISTEQTTFYELQGYIREKTNEFWKDTPLSIRFDFPNNEQIKKEIPIEIKRHLLMIFRESQNNIAKHAQATQVHLTLKIIDEKHFIFQIKDNGKGFDLTEKNSFSKGLQGIYKRAESIGASATIESVMGQGTVVTINVKFSFF